MAEFYPSSLQRRFERVNLRERTVLFFGKDSETSESLQISEGGMMTLSKLPLKKGDELTVHFNVREKFLRARAEVIYVLSPDEEEGPAKVGLRFKALFAEYRLAIRDALFA